MKFESIKQKSVQLQCLIEKGEAFFNLGSLTAHLEFIESWELSLKDKFGQINCEELFLKYSELERFILDLLNLFKEFRFVEFIWATESQKEYLIYVQGYLAQLEECSIQDVLQECMHTCLLGNTQWDEELSDIFQTVIGLLSSTEKLILSSVKIEKEWF